MTRSSDPIADAGRWLDRKLAGAAAPPLLVVIGLGEGHLLDLLEARAWRTRVLALEPDPRVARSFRSRRDWSGWIDSGRLLYLVDPDYAGADQAWRIFPPTFDSHIYLVHPSIERAPSPGAVRAARVTRDILFGVRANADARRRFAPRYLVNSLRNLGSIANGQDVRGLKDVFAGMPAVIAGAGPSLDQAIPELTGVADRAVIIATDTTMRPMLNAGLAPQLMVGLDPSTPNARHFRALPDTAGAWLIAESALDPIAVDAVDGRAFWFRAATHHPWPWYMELGIDVGTLDVWGSVLTAAFQVAVLAGCDPIVLVGADLAFTDDRPYCRGTTYELDWARSTACGRELEWAWREHVERQERVQHDDVRGRQTQTTRPLVAVRDWMVPQASRSGRRVINATGAGILLGGAVQQARSVAQVLSTFPPLPPLRDLAGLAPLNVSRSDLTAHMDRARRSLDGDGTEPALAPWAEFCGDGYEPDGVAAALSEAARAIAIDKHQRPHVGGLASVLAERRSSPLARRLFGRLPEAIARLRAALNGDAVLPSLPMPLDAPSPSDRQSLLLDSIDLLGAIYAVAVEHDDLTEPISGYWAGGLPVGSLCTWPDTTTWAAQVFEGLLGQAWRSPLAPEPVSFFLRPVVARDPPTESAAPAIDRPMHRNTTEACAVLAIEWILCAAGVAETTTGELGLLGGALRRLAEAFRPAPDVHGRGAGAAILIGVHAGERSAVLELPLPNDERPLARVLTGAIATAEGDLLTFARISVAAGLVATIGVRPAVASFDSGTVRRAPRHAPPRVTPRVLTDEILSRSLVSYGTEHGAVIAPFHGDDHGLQTFLLREDGSVEPYHSWPRSVVFELPIGASGAVAWNHRAPRFNQRHGSVMYRPNPDAAVSIEELPFGPLAGTWWRGRLYWVCWPAGVGSWAPGEAATFSFPDLSLCGIRGDADGLWLDPTAADGARPSRLPTHGWQWHPDRPDHAPERVALGPHGSATSCAVVDEWTAVAHPEADLIRLESAHGASRSMTCYWPYTVTWVGQSLLVGTRDGELLLFEHLLEALRSG